jgi:hypothetical protein
MSERMRNSGEGGARFAFLLNLGLAALLWAYSITRAYRLSFTHDESLTFFHSVLSPLADTLNFTTTSGANNHLLNSLLTRLSIGFGTGELALRLPNVLAHGMYLASALVVVRSVKPVLASVFAFIVLTLHPFLLDFFSMCRGYGLACSFTLLALVLLLKVVADPRVRPWLGCMASVAAGLAVLSNLSFLVFFLSFASIVCLAEMLKFASRVRQRMAGAALGARSLLTAVVLQTLVVALLCAVVVPIGLKLRELGELYYGGETGFMQDTLGSLLDASTYYLPYPAWLLSAVQGACALALAVVLGLAGRAAWKGDLAPAWVCAVPLLTAIVCVVQHHALGTRYPVDRTALFFIPMFALALVVASRAVADGRAAVLVLGAAALLLSANAARSLNFRYLAQWQYDAATRRMLEDLDAVRGARPVRLAIHWLFEPTIDYYREVRGLDWLQHSGRSGLLSDHDFYYYRDEDQADVQALHLERVHRYGRSQTTLARRRP